MGRNARPPSTQLAHQVNSEIDIKEAIDLIRETTAVEVKVSAFGKKHNIGACIASDVKKWLGEQIAKQPAAPKEQTT